MSEITLDKIDIIRERTGVTYTVAKESLEKCEGNVVDALVYIEEKEIKDKEKMYTTKDEFIEWLKDIVNSGNVNRIKIKKQDKVIVDIPINAGIAATLVALIWPPLIGVGILAAIFTKVTIEITKNDGSVEIFNKIIKNTAKDLKDKMYDTTSDLKNKVYDKTLDIKDKFKNNNDEDENKNVYSYTVNFEDIDKNNNEEDNQK